MISSFIYKTDLKAIKSAYDRYIDDIYSRSYEDTPGRKWRKEKKAQLSIPTWVTEEQKNELETKYWYFLEPEHFLPHCAWCSSPRCPVEDDNEHEDCDLRLYLETEEGKEEQVT